MASQTFETMKLMKKKIGKKCLFGKTSLADVQFRQKWEKNAHLWIQFSQELELTASLSTGLLDYRIEEEFRSCEQLN